MDVHTYVPPLRRLTTCANTVCTEDANLPCKKCHLVLYCSSSCQGTHWSHHETDCLSSVGQSTWKPSWNYRCPIWMTNADRPPANEMPGQQIEYLFGNMPAIDILNLERNEGLEFANTGDGISLLFAASGDLRNVVKTLSELPSLPYPDGQPAKLHLVINDIGFQIVARNTIMLLYVLASLQGTTTVPSGTAHKLLTIDRTASNLLHLWYSPFLTKDILTQITKTVGPLIDSFCATIDPHKGPGVVCSMTWSFRTNNHDNVVRLRVDLTKKDWFKLQKFLDNPRDLTFAKARELRDNIMSAPHRKHYHEKWLYKDHNPSTRIARQKYREDGMLLPFGNSRNEFDVPNPTFFHTGTWPCCDSADPMTTWPLDEVHKTPGTDGAVNDIYGRLFVYIHNELVAFITRLGSGIDATIEMHNLHCGELPRYLGGSKFARVEVSNLADKALLGPFKVLDLFSPLLQDRDVNSHATLITLHMGAVWETVTSGFDPEHWLRLNALCDAFAPFPKDGTFGSVDDNQRSAVEMVLTDKVQFFDKYLGQLGETRLGLSGLTRRRAGENTVVKEWPTAFPRFNPQDKDAHDEFKRILPMSYNGTERYVEWRRSR